MIHTDLIQLQEYAYLLNDEFGEYCLLIAAVYNRPECISPAFRTELDNEAYRLLKYFRDTYEICEAEELIPQTYKYLEEK